MEAKRFQKKIEDFTCGHCGQTVRGNGYTNHCPYCLWSKHVDINPGDRQATCHGLMAPVNVEQKAGIFVLVHRCQDCGFVRRNKVDADDDFDTVIAIAGKK
jgi:rubrerythrin